MPQPSGATGAKSASVGLGKNVGFGALYAAWIPFRVISCKSVNGLCGVYVFLSEAPPVQ